MRQNSDDTVRINKFLAHATGMSRREADDAITNGRVEINGSPAQLGASLLASDTVTVDKVPIAAQTDYRYVILNKPVGYVCSRKKQGDSPTVYELLPEQMRDLKVTGRLDRDSSGLVLFTNDGDYALAMTHPRYQKQKVYQVQLDTQLQPLHQQMISDYGVQLDDGTSSFMIEKFNTGYQVTMSEGRNRQIRRTFASLGYTVTRLHRTVFGPFRLNELKTGQIQTVRKA